MSNKKTSQKSIYEQPLNERTRTFLRFEQLANRFTKYSQDIDSASTHTAITALIEILSLISRGDIKQELLKEIKRQIDTLEAIGNKPQLNTNKLEEVLAKLKAAFDQLHTLHGQLGSHLKNNDFINSLRQRSSIPGGTCDFDLPDYHFWLTKPHSERKEILDEWFKPFAVVYKGVSETLCLIRESTPFESCVAKNGFYDQNLNHTQPHQLLRIDLINNNKIYPECSAGKHRFSIRFMEQANPNSNSRQSKSDIDFKLACCTF